VKKIFLIAWTLVSCMLPFLASADCDHEVDMPDSWCCPSEVKKFACWEALGKPLGEEACYSMGCYPNHLRRIIREREERKKKEKLDQAREQEKYDREKTRERSDQQAQKKFDQMKQQILERQRIRDYLNQRGKEEQERKEWARQQEEDRREQERKREQERRGGDTYQPSPPDRPSGSDNSECDSNGIRVNSTAWRSLTERQKESLLSLKKDFDTWNRNFPNKFKPYPWQWLQWFCQ
jgi:hypothetical protein